MIVISSGAEIELLNKILRKDENVILKLYKNNYTPVAGSVAGSFTVADFTGYSNKTLAKTSWPIASNVSPVSPCTDIEASSSYAEQSWTCGSSGNTVYGYYVIGATSNVLLWADKFSAARTIAEGDILRIVPKFQLRSQKACV